MAVDRSIFFSVIYSFSASDGMGCGGASLAGRSRSKNRAHPSHLLTACLSADADAGDHISAPIAPAATAVVAVTVTCRDRHARRDAPCAS